VGRWQGLANLSRHCTLIHGGGADRECSAGGNQVIFHTLAFGGTSGHADAGSIDALLLHQVVLAVDGALRSNIQIYGGQYVFTNFKTFDSGGVYGEYIRTYNPGTTASFPTLDTVAGNAAGDYIFLNAFYGSKLSLPALTSSPPRSAVPA